MAVFAVHVVPRALLLAVLVWGSLAAPEEEAKGTPSMRADQCSAAPFEASASVSAALLQRRSLVNVDTGLPSEHNSKLPQDPAAVALEDDAPKFLAGVPVHNYGYVRRLKRCEQVLGRRCRLGLLGSGAPVTGLKKDWEEDFLHNDDIIANDDDDQPAHHSDADHGHPYQPSTPLEELEDSRFFEMEEPGDVREWLVKMRDGVSDQVLMDFCDDVRSAKGSKAKCTAQGHPSEGGIPLVVVRSTEEELEEQLRLHQGKTDYVEPDIPMNAIPEVRSKEGEPTDGYGEDSSGAKNASASWEDPFSWGLDRIDDRRGLDGSYDIGPEGGKDVHVYVADTGIRTKHQDFEGRAIPTLEIRRGILRECEASNHRCSQDFSGHGTHSAATVGGKKYGVAKSSTLHSVKILSAKGHGKMSYLIQALDWVATRGKRPAVFVVGVGGQGNPPSIVNAIEAASTSGVTVVVAAGNGGHDACDWSPAHAKAAITVGATENADDIIASYSNIGACVDLYAPGSDIHSAGVISDTARGTMSGTSMSTPHVAGAAALLLGEDDTRSPKEVAQLLKARATQSGDTKDAQGSRASRILYTGELADGDEIWWQETWWPAWQNIFLSSRWKDVAKAGPMKELMAQGFVCCLFLITLAFMTTQCMRFFIEPPDAYEKG